MKLDISIVRTPFGVTNAMMATELYGVEKPFDLWKKRSLREHLTALSDNLDLLDGELLSVQTQFSDVTKPDYDGRVGEWWSVIHFDRRP